MNAHALLTPIATVPPNYVPPAPPRSEGHTMRQRGDATRESIVALIAAGYAKAADMAPVLRISPERVRRHLLRLEAAGLVAREKIGHGVVWLLTGAAKAA